MSFYGIIDYVKVRFKESKMETYEGHKVIIANGYYDVYYPEHPRARKNGSVLMHIMVAEKILGRQLKKEEVVHHIDSNRLNNSISNLMVFATHSDHASYHKMLEGKGDFVFYQLDNVYYCCNVKVFLNPNIITVDKAKKKPCPKCGQLISYTSELCTRCLGESRRKVERVSRDVLKNKIRKSTFVQISSELGVSDNAIRKWCKWYGLPYKSSDIKKYSDIEWVKV